MRSSHDRRIAFLMVVPSLILLAIFVYGFIFSTVRNSFTNWGEDRTMGSALDASIQTSFVGLSNYQNLMSEFLSFHFRTAMVNTFFYTILFVGGCLLVGFLLAVLLDSNVHFENLFRTIFLFPMALSLVVTGTIWRWLYQPVGLNSLPTRLFGLDPYMFNWINSRKTILPFDWNNVPTILSQLVIFILALLVVYYLVRRYFFNAPKRSVLGFVVAIVIIALLDWSGFWRNTIWPHVMNIGSTPENPLPVAEMKGFQVALTGIIIAAVWQMSGYVMAMFLAGMRGVPDELREAARVDGCSELGVYWRIVLPQLKPVALSAMVILGHISLKSFDLVFSMTGKDNFQTIVPGVIVYSAFDNNRFAWASAVAVIMLVLVCTVIIPYLWSQLRDDK